MGWACATAAVLLAGAAAATAEDLVRPPIPPAPANPRQDGLILQTMDAEQMQTFILDGLEDALPEIEAFWAEPVGGKAGFAGPGASPQAFGQHYAMLLLERPKATYCHGLYSRELLLSHADPAGLTEKEIICNYFRRRARNQTPPLPAQTGDVLPTAVERHAYFRRLQETVTSHGYDTLICPGWGGREFANNLHDYGAFDDGQRLYPSPAADWDRSEAYVRHLHSWMSYYSTAQDRAVRWAGADGLSLAEVSATFYPNHHPDFSAEHHGTTSWAYILAGSAQGGRLYRTLFAAAVSGRKPGELIPPLRANDWPDLAVLAGYTRRFLRNLVGPEGSAMWPMSSEGYENRITSCDAFTLHMAYDATVNRNPESAACLSRSIQRALRCIRSPNPACQASGPYYTAALTQVITAYYMVKHWGLPTELPSWEQMQAADGGTTFFRYQDWYVHRNPFKVLTVRTGRDPASDACNDGQIHCSYCPTPQREGHGMDFLQPFRAFRYVRRVTPPLERSDRGAPLFGDYGRVGQGIVAQPWCTPAGRGTQRCRASDGGVSVALFQRHPREPGVVRRALFSLDGRLTAIIEESPCEGRFAPTNFLVKNIEGYSRREGAVPRVRWRITTADGTVAFADLQQAEDGSEARISAAARWYDIDDLHAVAVAEPMPLILAPTQFRDVRDTLYFGPGAGGAAVVYAGVAATEMPRLAEAVQPMTGLPAGVRGLAALAPEGYRVFAMANFADGDAEYVYSGRTPEGAPVFSVPTDISPAGQSRAAFRFGKGPDLCSEEPHFYVAASSGATLRATGRYHRLELTAQGGPATATVRFLGAARTGKLRLDGTAGVGGDVDAAALREQGIQLALKPDEAAWLAVGGGPDADRLGPFVDVTAPRWTRDTRPPPQRMGSISNGHLGRWEPIRGTFTFKADAADRSGVRKVEFYLNNGRLIGTAAEPPYECQYEVKEPFCQYVYAVAYDTLGNSRKSFVVPFGDGSIGPSEMKP